MSTILDSRQTELREQLDNTGTEAFSNLTEVLREIDKSSDQLRVKPESPISQRVVITAATLSKNTGFSSNIALDNKMVSFDGAVIDFESGEIFEADGVTSYLAGANDFTPFALNADEYFYYAISITTGTANPDNTATLEIEVTQAASANTVLASAPKANFTSGTVPLAQVYVKENGANTGILDIDWDNIQQISGVPSSSGESDSGSSYELQNLGISTTVAANALTIAIKTGAGANASTIDPITVGFRNATSATGQFSTVNISSALSTVISSGSTAGQISGVASYIYVYLINNAGTAELAWSRSLYDEGSLVSTTAEGGAGGADNASVIYSTTARSNVAVRLVGRLLNTQATAGTWVTAPSEISLVPFFDQVVACRYNSNSGQSVVNGNTIVFENLIYDSHSSYNTSTGVWTCPSTGYYNFESTILTNSVAAGAISDYLGILITNNTTGITVGGPFITADTTVLKPNTSIISVTLYAVVNQEIVFRFNEQLPAVNLSTNILYNWMSITKRVG